MVSLAEIVTVGADSVPFVPLEGLSELASTCPVPEKLDCFDAAAFAAAVLFCCSCGMTRSLSICPNFSSVAVTGAADMVMVYCASKTNKGRREARMLENIDGVRLGNVVSSVYNFL